MDGYSATFSGGYRPDELSVFSVYPVCIAAIVAIVAEIAAITESHYEKREYLCLTSNRILRIQYMRNHQ